MYVNNEAAKKLYIANGWVERKTDSTLTSLLMVCAPPYNVRCSKRQADEDCCT